MKAVLLFLFAIICITCSAQLSNPVLDKDFPDPTVIRSGSKYYAYATNSGANIQVAVSEDLQQWKILSDAMPAKPVWADKDFWAPHVLYDSSLKKYLLFYSGESVDEKLGKCLGIAFSDAPEGPFVDMGKPLLCGETFVNIDPMAFADPKTGRHWLFWGSGLRPIKVQEMNKDWTAFLPGTAPKDVIPVNKESYDRLVEGAWVDYENGKYYLYYSGDNCCGERAHYAVMVARSDNVTGPYERFGETNGTGSSVILEQDSNWLAPGHNSIVSDDRGRKYIAYHAISKKQNRKNGGRVFCIAPVEYVNGWPQISVTDQRDTSAPLSSNIKNPVLPGVADAGVIKFNGEYYIGGVFTNGSFYRSRDLVKWDGPFHVFSMNNKWTEGASAGDQQIHANDMVYLNGVFHLFWSVNYWGKDRNAVHIGHAKSKNILGPYEEPEKNKWVENRIDPKLFVDDDGKCYLYMVKFTDGNTIWVQPMLNPDTLTGEPAYMFSSLPNTWETRDNRVEEGPWVIKYRNRYYMMYNANHTSPAWGNYALGVAEAASPTGFNHGNKYPYPLLQSNQVQLEDRYPDLLKFSANTDLNFQYRFTAPGNEWTRSLADSAEWKKGRPGFASSYIKNATVRNMRSSWTSPEIWVRKPFRVEQMNGSRFLLRINHDGPAGVFLNGQNVYNKTARAYQAVFLNRRQLQYLKQGENILAVHAKAGNNSNFLDVALFQTDSLAEEDILYSPGQPNILRGPNGFEWWLIYMANRNSDRRGQYINRIQFFNKQMYAEGVTGPHSPGYHPEPTPPDFSDLFDSTAALGQGNWEFSGTGWIKKNGELNYTGSGYAQAFFKTMAARHYLFEINLLITKKNGGKAGIIAYRKDNNNWLKIGLNAASRTWFYQYNQNGKLLEKNFAVSADFDFSVYHQLTLFRNDGQFNFQIDGRPAPGASYINFNIDAASRPGIFADKTPVFFDGILYTIGWDEYDSNITGWNKAGSKQWRITGDGLQINAGSESSVFKGEFLDNYEFSTQISPSGFAGTAGVYAAYEDEQNFIRCRFDFSAKKLIIDGRFKGKPLEEKRIGLECRQDLYPDMKYTDFFEKVFSLNDNIELSGVFLNKIPHGNPDTVIEDIHLKMDIYYRENGDWKKLEHAKVKTSTHGGFVYLSFSSITADALKFVNKQPADQQFYLSKIGIDEVFRDNYNLRIVNRNGKQIYFVNGREVYHSSYTLGPSRPGLTGAGASFIFNGISCFHIPR
jgi:beta-xylosidase